MTVTAPTGLTAARQQLPGWAAEAFRHEAAGVTRVDTAELAAAGLYAVSGPPELGGLDPAQQREAHELLAGACPDLWFVWYQHGPVVRMLSSSPNDDVRERHLAALCAGTAQAGVAFSHLRTSRPSITATRADGGFRLSGSQPWCTFWPHLDLVLIGAVHQPADAEPEVVLALIPAGDQPGLRSTGELTLAAMGGTSTHALAVEDLPVSDADVLLRLPRSVFLANDSAANANVQPATFGVARSALAHLADLDQPAAEPLQQRLDRLRADSEALLALPAAEQVPQRLEVRAQALTHGMHCATALLAARGGRGMNGNDVAQLLLRAAAFQVVHAQAAHVRDATLAALR